MLPVNRRDFLNLAGRSLWGLGLYVRIGISAGRVPGAGDRY